MGQTALPVQGRELDKEDRAGTDPAAQSELGREPEVSHPATVTSCTLCPPWVPSALPSQSAPALTSAVACMQPGANSQLLDDPSEGSSIYLHGRTTIFNSNVVLSSL